MIVLSIDCSVSVWVTIMWKCIIIIFRNKTISTDTINFSLTSYIEHTGAKVHTHTHTQEYKQRPIQLVSSVTQQSCDWLETDCIAEKQLYSAIVILPCASPILQSEYDFSQSLCVCAILFSLPPSHPFAFSLFPLPASGSPCSTYTHMWLSNERPDWWNVTSTSLTDTDTEQHLFSRKGPLDGLWL